MGTFFGIFVAHKRNSVHRRNRRAIAGRGQIETERGYAIKPTAEIKEFITTYFQKLLR